MAFTTPQELHDALESYNQAMTSALAKYEGKTRFVILRCVEQNRQTVRPEFIFQVAVEPGCRGCPGDIVMVNVVRYLQTIDAYERSEYMDKLSPRELDIYKAWVKEVGRGTIGYIESVTMVDGEPHAKISP